MQQTLQNRVVLQGMGRDYELGLNAFRYVGAADGPEREAAVNFEIVTGSESELLGK